MYLVCKCEIFLNAYVVNTIKTSDLCKKYDLIFFYRSIKPRAAVPDFLYSQSVNFSLKQSP